jgi:hypothetical protein
MRSSIHRALSERVVRWIILRSLCIVASPLVIGCTPIREVV